MAHRTAHRSSKARAQPYQHAASKREQLMLDLCGLRSHQLGAQRLAECDREWLEDRIARVEAELAALMGAWTWPSRHRGRTTVARPQPSA